MQKPMTMPHEYRCSLCDYTFLEGEVPQNFCPNCGSSMIAILVTYEEYLEDEGALHPFESMGL